MMYLSSLNGQWKKAGDHYLKAYVDQICSVQVSENRHRHELNMMLVKNAVGSTGSQQLLFALNLQLNEQLFD